jgi:hypothetical protein
MEADMLADSEVRPADLRAELTRYLEEMTLLSQGEKENILLWWKVRPEPLSTKSH